MSLKAPKFSFRTREQTNREGAGASWKTEKTRAHCRLLLTQPRCFVSRENKHHVSKQINCRQGTETTGEEDDSCLVSICLPRLPYTYAANRKLSRSLRESTQKKRNKKKERRETTVNTVLREKIVFRRKGGSTIRAWLSNSRDSPRLWGTERVWRNVFARVCERFLFEIMFFT